MSADVPYTVSQAAAEGTLLHQISEMQLKDRMENAMLETYWLDRTEVIEDFEIEINQDMIDCAKAYVDYVNETTERLDGKLLIEEKVSLEEISDKCWGTADAIVLGDNKIAVIDFKSGKWPVTAEHNKQLSIYGLGALARYGDEETTLAQFVRGPCKRKTWWCGGTVNSKQLLMLVMRRTLDLILGIGVAFVLLVINAMYINLTKR
jgi:hypothetical protein